MTLAGIATLNLVNRPVRSVLTVAGVMLAIAACVALIGLVRGIEATLLQSLDSRGADLVLTEGGAEDLLSSLVPQDLAGAAGQHRAIAAASPELTRMTTLSSGASAFVLAWPGDAFGWKALTLTAGRFPLPADDGGVVIGRSLATRLGLAPGGEVELFSRAFHVVGIVDSASLINRNMVIGLLADMQAQTYRAGQATSIVMQFHNDLSPAERQAAAAELRQQFPTFSVEETAVLVREYTYARIARILAWSVSLVALISAVLAVLNTMAMAVNERRAEIAIMGAVGWPGHRIIACLLTEGAMLSLIGGFAGAALGTAVAWGVAKAPAVEGFVEPLISVGLLGQAIALALGIGLVGALVPAWRSVRRNPAEVLRGH